MCITFKLYFVCVHHIANISGFLESGRKDCLAVKAHKGLGLCLGFIRAEGLKKYFSVLTKDIKE